MSLLIATPMFGGQCTRAYFRSCVALERDMAGFPHDWHTMTNDSLITRARDCIARDFLESPYEYLLFIDADMDFRTEDVFALWQMQTAIAVAAYPMKRLDMPLSAWLNGELVTFPVEEPKIKVDLAGTGFMMIHRKVFEAMKAVVPEYREDAELKPTWGFFQDPIVDGVHLSEDYFFCKTARELGYDIEMDTTIRLGHVGQWTYGHDVLASQNG